MMNNNVNNDKKKSLLAYKDKILEEIKYYETRIKDFRANHKNNSYRYEDSSDSEDELLELLDRGPSVAQLKIKQEVMKTCLLATQELTSLTVLQSQVNVLVDAPDIDREKPITEPGLWTEVTAECEIDLTNFTIHFYMHKPYRTFAPPSYRCLRVEPVRDSDKLELDKSVLHSLKLPSDAVEVMRSYNAAFRSRRTTLSKLDKKFANSILMEKHPEGGYIFKCAGLLEVCWRLENKWSPVAPFHHRMKFDLEYMDESYIKIITQAHKQLLDPSLQTDERTLLLSKIISTCLEARGPIESESDLESKTEKDEFEKRDSEVMAPPKSLPKKSKAKDNKKRSLNEENEKSVKRLRTNEFENLNSRKTKIVDENASVVKKMRVGDGVASAKNVQENADDGTQKNNSPKDVNIEDKIDEHKKAKKSNAEVKNKIKNKITKDTNTEEKTSSTKTKNIQKESENGDAPKHNKELVETEATKDKNGNTKPTNKISKGSGDKVVKKLVHKPKNTASAVAEVETGNSKPKSKIPKESGNTAIQNANNKPKNVVNDNTELNNGNTAAKITKSKPKNAETESTEGNDKEIAVEKNPKDTGYTATKNTNIKPKNVENKNNDEKNTNPMPTIKTVQNAGNTEVNKISKTKPKITREPSNLDKAITKPKNTQKESGNTEKDNINTKPKNNEKKEINVAGTKNAEDKNNDNVATKDVDSQSKIVTKKSNVVISKKSNSDLNKAVNKTLNNKKSVVSAKNDDKVKKNTDINTQNKENADVLNKGTKKIKDGAIIKKTTQKNATNRIKDKISTITEKVSDKNIQGKQTIIKSNINLKKTSSQPKIIQNLPSHRNSIKLPITKVLKASNTAVKSGNTDKNGGKTISKIPQKRLAPISKSSSKKNPLRISPRKMPAKFISTVDVMKQKAIKATSIPRLMTKDSVPKRTQ